MSVSRIVADDYLVSFRTNRYSVPFTLIGQTVELLARGGQMEVLHRGALVASHPLLEGKHQLKILPAHGPGASARNARKLRSSRPAGTDQGVFPQVEVRDLAVYDSLLVAQAQVVLS